MNQTLLVKENKLRLSREALPPKIYTRLETITPKIASQYILRNHKNNRNLKPSVVQHLALQMTNGEWETTHQGIAFDTEGNLIDGLHRMSALVLSGTTAEMMVTYGLKDASCIDVGSRRTINDLIALSGERRSVAYTSILHGMFSFNAFNRKKITPMHWVNLEKIHRQSLLYMEEIQRMYRGKRVFVGCTLGPGARALYHYSTEEVKKFYQILSTGMITCPQDTAPATLRTWMTSNRNLDKEQTYRKTESALEAFLQGRPLTKIYMTAKELFPLGPREDFDEGQQLNLKMLNKPRT